MTKTKTPIVILASGRGSNFDAIADAVQSGKLDAEIRAVVCDKAGAPVLDKARARGILPVLLDQPKALLTALQGLDARFLVLAGYMRILPLEVIHAFRSERGYTRIVNIHPSLLPAFPGLRAYEQAYRHGAKVAGVTVHLVDEGLDSGPICAQEAFSISHCETLEEIERLGLEIEHRLYPESLRWILREEFEMDWRESVVAPGRGSVPAERRLCVRPN